MRTTIKVTDLTLRQWDELQDSLLTEYDMPPGAVRVCVTFESDAATVEERHVEMPVRVFTNLLRRLDLVGTAEAALTPDALPDVVRRADLPEPDRNLLNEIREFPSMEHYE